MFVSEILSETEYKVTVSGTGQSKSFNVINVDTGETVGRHRNSAMANKQKQSLVKKLPTPADKLKKIANTKGQTVDRAKGVRAADQYLDKKDKAKDIAKKGKNPKELGKGFLKKLGLGPQKWFGPFLQFYISIDQIGTLIYNFNDIYIKSGCNARDPSVNAYHRAIGQEVTGIFIATAASALAGGAASRGLKKIKDLKTTLQLIGNITVAAPVVGWIARVISFIGIEAAFYALGKALGSSKLAEGMADWFMTTAFTKAQLVDYVATFDPETYKVCQRRDENFVDSTDEDEYFVEQTVSKTAVKNDVMKIIKDDPKLMSMVKKIKSQKTKAKAT
tara:strand:- start:1449 stop:2447 length:999 start_codon:yes stop_codon:yes gene_type:complete